ncbi:uncharacterized protein LOC135486704 [Lineus longissimus]|uniref:uncharacterized protein LOC135486704 n=1 Tax=Lineus longissimus TaxID=88925 RepID=UPI002B4CD554
MFKMYLAILFVVLSIMLTSSLVGSSRNDQKIKISVWQVSGDKVRIHWQSAYKKMIQQCELSINPSHGVNMKVIQNYIPSQSGFEVDQLKPSTEYTIFILCHDNLKNTYSSNFVSFKTGNDSHLFKAATKDGKYYESHESSKYSRDYPRVFREKLTTSVSTLDIALGVVFSLFGVIIIISGAFYFWRKYQRRRRIRRFTRHQDTDSFPDLQTTDSNSDVQLSSQNSFVVSI